MAKIKKEKPVKEKPVKVKKEKSPKATRTPRQPKARKPKIKYKGDLYTLILLFSFLAIVTGCIFLYLNNSFHAANM
ncbi:MAG: hypothetical protein LBJ67_02510 [Planctomycetaceae bacterium]|jgi:hypothetical protein|nr:hypothetical protein [Planctomycetaceae bacterium]